jgi:hypothetical protein
MGVLENYPLISHLKAIQTFSFTYIKFQGLNIPSIIGDWTEHFGINPYRKPTNASK